MTDRVTATWSDGNQKEEREVMSAFRELKQMYLDKARAAAEELDALERKFGKSDEPGKHRKSLTQKHNERKKRRKKR